MKSVLCLTMSVIVFYGLSQQIQVLLEKLETGYDCYIWNQYGGLTTTYCDPWG